MIYRIAARAVLVILAMFATAGFAFADSMLTSPPVNSDKGLIFVGDENNSESRDIEKDAERDEILLLSVKKNKMVCPEAQSADPKSGKGRGISEPDDGKYPPIHVRCKVYVPAETSSNTAYKYKKLSSRHKGRASSRMMATYQYVDITPIIVREAKKNGISPTLLKAVIHAESEFRPYAVSPAGAMGLTQLMPRTARLMGVSDPFDVEQSIAGGAKYLGLLSRMFDSLDLIIAAYNAGPGAVKRAGGIPNIYETQRYVVKVKSRMKW